MEQQYFLGTNGQEIRQQEINLMGEEAALADDRTLAELLHVSPGYSIEAGGGIVKGIIPFRMNEGGTVAGVVRGGTGGVYVGAFRAVIGSRTDETEDPKAHFRDIRTAIYVPDVEDSESLASLITFNDNISGNHRWDLVYAKVTIDTDDAADFRYIKDPTTAVIDSVSVATTKSSTVTIGVVEGTPSGSPGSTPPSLPSDSGNDYYIPLAYVLIRDGFDNTEVLVAKRIAEQYTAFQISPDVGGHPAGPALCNSSKFTTNAVETLEAQTWNLNDVRPPAIMPAGAVGVETIWVALDLKDDSSNWNVQSGGVIDNTRNWRHRFFHITGAIYASDKKFATDPTASTNTVVVPSISACVSTSAAGQGFEIFSQFGQSLVSDGGLTSLGSLAGAFPAASIAGTAFRILHLDDSNFSAWLDGTIDIYVDSVGVMRLQVSNEPDVRLFLRIDASGPMLAP